MYMYMYVSDNVLLRGLPLPPGHQGEAHLILHRLALASSWTHLPHHRESTRISHYIQDCFGVILVCISSVLSELRWQDTASHGYVKVCKSILAFMYIYIYIYICMYI